MDTETKVEDFLAHYGVKGMRWGVRRRRSSDGSPKRISRKERRATRRAEKKAFYENKANNILTKAMADPDVLVSVMTPNSPYPTVVTGREFVEHVSRGGVFNIRATDIFAERNPEGGGYVQNQRMNERYRPS